VIAYLGDLGLPLSYKFEAARQPLQVGRLLGNGIILVAVQWVALAAIGTPIVWLVLRSYGSEALNAGIIFLHLYVPVNLVTRYVNALNHGTGAFKRFNAVRGLVPGCYLVLLGLIWVLGLDTLGWVVASVAISNVVAMGVAIGWSMRPLLRGTRVERDMSLLRRTFSYGTQAHLGDLTPVDSMRLDLLAVTALLGGHEVGLYAVAASAVQVVRAQGAALGMAVLPEVGRQRDARSGAQLLGNYVRPTILLMVGTAVALGALSGPFLGLVYGQDFSAAAPIMKILMLGAVAAALRQLLGDGLRGVGHPRRATVAEIGSWVVALPAIALFVPMLGAVGAAIAATVVYSTAAVLCVALVSRLGIPWTSLVIPRRRDMERLLTVPRAVTGKGGSV
jgi:O-antigen/teichoic acid export membrane protein